MLGKMIITCCLVAYALATYPSTTDSRAGGNVGQSYNGAAAEDETPKPYEFSYDVQDEEGNTHSRSESGNEQGVVTGSYGYALVNGIYRTVEYIADRKGFRAVVQTNEPGTDNENPADVDITAEEPPAGVVPQNNGYGKNQASGGGYGSQQSPRSYGSQQASNNGHGSEQKSQNDYGTQQTPRDYHSQQTSSNGYESPETSRNGYGSQVNAGNDYESNGNNNKFDTFSKAQTNSKQAQSGSYSTRSNGGQAFSNAKRYGTNGAQSANAGVSFLDGHDRVQQDANINGYGSKFNDRGQKERNGNGYSSHKRNQIPIMMAPYGQL